MKIKFNISLLFLVMFFVKFSSAQVDSCILKLKAADQSFEQGNYDVSIRLLKESLNGCNLTKNEKIQANKLLILSFIKVDNLEDAEKVANKIMKIDPNFKADKFKDDPKLSTIFEKFRPTPFFRAGFNTGINRTMVDVVNTYSIVHADDKKGLSQYNAKTGFQLGACAEYRTFRNLWVNLGVQFRQSKYQHLLDSIEGATVDFSERLTYFDVPLSLKYYFIEKKFSPYIQAGANFTFLTNALSTTIREESQDLVNRTDYRNANMIGVFGGLGLAYKLNSLQFYVDFRYFNFSENLNKEGTRYADLTNVFKYYYIDDDFRLNNWQINAGINFNIIYKNK
jgi:outer membrane protein W